MCLSVFSCYFVFICLHLFAVKSEWPISSKRIMGM